MCNCFQLNLTPPTHTHTCISPCPNKYRTFWVQISDNAVKYALLTYNISSHLKPACGSFQCLLSTLTTFIYRLEKRCRRWMTSPGQSTWSRWMRRNTSRMMSFEIDIGWVMFSVFSLLCHCWVTFLFEKWPLQLSWCQRHLVINQRHKVVKDVEILTWLCASQLVIYENSYWRHKPHLVVIWANWL